MRGWWDCDDLTALVRVLLRSTTAPRRGPLSTAATLAGPVLDPIALLRRRDGAADRSHVRAHYDLGNDFFALMLDETMTYSSRCSRPPAHRSPRHRRPSSTASAAASAWRPTTTWSRSGRAGAASPCTPPPGTGAGSPPPPSPPPSTSSPPSGWPRPAWPIACHRAPRPLPGPHRHLRQARLRRDDRGGGWRDHRSFFGACADRLRPGGLAAMQAIVIGDEAFDRAKHHDDFIRRYIFPAGACPR